MFLRSLLSSGESLSLRTCNWNDDACLDIKASGFWGDRFQSSIFDVRIFNPYAPSNRFNPTASMNARSAEHTKGEFVTLNMHVSVLLCSPPREAWVPPLQLHISVWPSFCPLSGRPLTVEL